MVANTAHSGTSVPRLSSHLGSAPQFAPQLQLYPTLFYSTLPYPTLPYPYPTLPGAHGRARGRKQARLGRAARKRAG